MAKKDRKKEKQKAQKLVEQAQDSAQNNPEVEAAASSNEDEAVDETVKGEIIAEGEVVGEVAENPVNELEAAQPVEEATVEATTQETITEAEVVNAVAENQANAPDAAQEAIETVELVGEVKSQADETVQTVEPEVTEAAQQTEVIEEPLLSSVSSAVENSSAPSASSVVQNSSAVSASSAVKPKKARSVAIFPMNLGGTNGARMELEAIFVPPYNAARYGISMTTSPKHADIIFLFGNGTIKMLPYALELLASLPDDVKLVVLGSDGPIARDTGEKGYMVRGLKIENVAQPTVSGQVYSSIDEFVLPPGKKIAAYITGSPPDPQSIINFILQIS